MLYCRVDIDQKIVNSIFHSFISELNFLYTGIKYFCIFIFISIIQFFCSSINSGFYLNNRKIWQTFEQRNYQIMNFNILFKRLLNKLIKKN
jgi:hypothetical protein